MQSVSVRSLGTSFILYGLLVVELFCSPEPLLIPSIQLGVVLRGIIFSFLLFVGVVFIRSDLPRRFSVFNIDMLVVFLGLQVCYYCLLGMVYGQTEHFIRQLSMLAAFCAYLWTINCDVSPKFLLRWTELFILIIGLEIFWVVGKTFQMGIPLYMLKAFIHIPLGRSNYIATFVIILLPLIYKLEPRKLWRNFFLLLTGGIILLSRSNSGFIAFGVETFLLLLTDKKDYFIRFILLLAGIIGITYLIKYNQNDYLTRLTSSLEKMRSLDSYELGQVSNNRLYLWEQAFNLWLGNPIFGIGYTRDYFMAHNWILERLLSGGGGDYASLWQHL